MYSAPPEALRTGLKLYCALKDLFDQYTEPSEALLWEEGWSRWSPWIPFSLFYKLFEDQSNGGLRDWREMCQNKTRRLINWQLLSSKLPPFHFLVLLWSDLTAVISSGSEQRSLSLEQTILITSTWSILMGQSERKPALLLLLTFHYEPHLLWFFLLPPVLNLAPVLPRICPLDGFQAEKSQKPYRYFMWIKHVLPQRTL